MKPKRQGTKIYSTVERLARLKELLRTGDFTFEEIVEMIPAYGSDLQFQKLRRDLKALEQLGYHVRQDAFNKRYRVRAASPELDWSEAELGALATVRELFREGLPYVEGVQSLLKQLERGMREAERQVYEQTPPISMSLQVTPDYSTFAPTLRKLEKLLNKQRIMFDYRAPGKGRTLRHRDVQPVYLEFRDGHYCLWGYSFERSRYLEFRVDRIAYKSLRVLPHHGSSIPLRRTIAFQCRLSAKLAEGGTQPRFPIIDAVEPQSDGSILITAQGYSAFRIIQEALRYGEEAEIVSPDWLRGKMKETTNRMVGIYSRE